MNKEIIILSESHIFWQYMINYYEYDNTDQQHRTSFLCVYFNAKIFLECKFEMNLTDLLSKVILNNFSNFKRILWR